jgi:hypothetical protein
MKELKALGREQSMALHHLWEACVQSPNFTMESYKRLAKEMMVRWDDEKPV